MRRLRSYSNDEPIYDGKAYKLSSMYYAGNGGLLLYASHVTRREDGSLEYQMSAVDG